MSITTGAYATALTIDGSALDAASIDSDGNGKINNSDASAEILTVVGTSATKALTITGGGAGDALTAVLRLTLSTVVVVMTLSWKLAVTILSTRAMVTTRLTSIARTSDLTYQDDIDGGAGTDTLMYWYRK